MRHVLRFTADANIAQREFLSLVEFETKKKKAAVKEAGYYLERLTKNIDRDEQGLKNELERLASTAYVFSMSLQAEADYHRTKKDLHFLGVFKKAYKEATPFPPPADAETKSTSELRGFAVMYERSKQLTEVASELVARFERVGHQVSGHDTTALMDNEWGEEDKHFAHLVLVGKDLGITRCQSILNAPKEAVMIPEDIKRGDVLYSEDQLSFQWGTVARKEEKAARKLVKAVTSDNI